MVLNREFSLSDQVTAVFPKLRKGRLDAAKNGGLDTSFVAKNLG